MGLTARNHRHISLHGKAEPAPEKAGKSKHATDRATSEDINAPPESSSDECASKDEDEVDSDESILDIRESRRKPMMDSAPLKNTSSTYTSGEENRLPPSSIPSSNFVKNSGLPKSQKRSREDLEAEENDKIDAWSSQPKKPKKMYTHSSQNNSVANIHLSKSTDESKMVTKKTASPKIKSDERQFRAPDTSWNTSPGKIQIFQL